MFIFVRYANNTGGEKAMNINNNPGNHVIRDDPEKAAQTLFLFYPDLTNLQRFKFRSVARWYEKSINAWFRLLI